MFLGEPLQVHRILQFLRSLKLAFKSYIFRLWLSGSGILRSITDFIKNWFCDKTKAKANRINVWIIIEARLMLDRFGFNFSGSCF